MSRQRIRHLMKKVGVQELLLANCQTIKDFSSGLANLNDGRLLDAWERTIRARAVTLSDDQLLRELDEMRREADQKQRSLKSDPLVVG